MTGVVTSTDEQGASTPTGSSSCRGESLLMHKPGRDLSQCRMLLARAQNNPAQATLS